MLTINDILYSADELLKNDDLLYSLRDILRDYDGRDIMAYVNFNDMHYNRFLVAKSEYSQILLLCWKKGQSSAFHDHHNNGCIVKIISGSLKEFIYDTKTCITSDKISYCNDILYKQGNDIIHKIEPLENLISLHIYPLLYKLNTYDCE